MADRQGGLGRPRASHAGADETAVSGAGPEVVEPEPPARRRSALARSVRLGGFALLGAVVALALLIIVLWATTSSPRSSSPGWTRLADGLEARGEVASAVGARVGGCEADACLYVLGGLRGLGRTSSAVTVYDPDRDAWHRGPSLPAGRHHAAAAWLDGALYLTGGAVRATSFSPVADAWMLRSGADAWASLPDMPEGRLGHQLIAVDGRLFVVGGDGPSADVLVLDPATATWKRGAALAAQRDHLGAVVLGGEIWAIGGRPGRSPVRHVDVYNRATDSWRSGPPLPVPVSAAAVGVLDGDIHVVGGEDPAPVGGGVIDRHLVLPAGSNEWEDGPLPLVATHGSGWGVIDDRLYIFAGSRRQGVLSVLGWTGVTAVFEPAAR